jgi:hypothetical protein
MGLSERKEQLCKLIPKTQDILQKNNRPAFLQLLKTFLKILAKFIDVWGDESKTELSFSLSHTISPESALSIISCMCILG